jgi:hypothetical protein
MNGYVHNGKVNGRAGNGFVPRAMNITNNPLADSEQDKVHFIAYLVQNLLLPDSHLSSLILNIFIVVLTYFHL